jgi:hypothetical protein
MKNNSLLIALVGVLLVSCLISSVLCYLYVTRTREARQIQGLQQMVMAANNNRNLVQALARDLVEYSKTDPDITPLLRKHNIIIQTNNAAQPANP